MAYVSEVTVGGLAGFEGDRTFHLDRHANVFWGSNGAGKTSLLRIIHAALNDDVDALETIPFKTAKLTIHEQDPEAVFVRKIDMTEDIDEPGSYWSEEDEAQIFDFDDQRSWSTHIVAGPKIIPRRFLHTYLPVSRIVDSRFARRIMQRAGNRALGDATSLDKMFAEQVSKRWVEYNAAANGNIREIQQQGLAEILSILFGGAATNPKNAKNVPNENDAYGLVRDFLRRQNLSLQLKEEDFKSRYRLEGDLPEVVAHIGSVLAEIEEELLPQKKMQELIGDLYSGNKGLTLDSQGVSVTREGVGEIPLESLSSGEKQLLQLFLETISAGSAPVMIDEPELSMHVQWQQPLVANMSLLNTSCQLILATHSPEIMAELSERNIHEI